MYIKPIVIKNTELFEGVYVYSGDPVVDGNIDAPSVTYSLGETHRDDWNHVKDYRITFTNNSDQTLSSITASVKVNGTITSIGGNVSGIVYGDHADITFYNYGNAIAPHSEVVCDYVHVTGTGDFSLE